MPADLFTPWYVLVPLAAIAWLAVAVMVWIERRR